MFLCLSFTRVFGPWWNLDYQFACCKLNLGQSVNCGRYKAIKRCLKRAENHF